MELEWSRSGERRVLETSVAAAAAAVPRRVGRESRRVMLKEVLLVLASLKRWCFEWEVLAW